MQLEGGAATRRPASSLLIYCHANSEDLGSLYPCAKWISQMLGVHVLVPEFPGYGLCGGSPNEDSINGAVKSACRFAIEELGIDASRIVLYGRSIGTGPSAWAASQGYCGALVLISPYTSIKEIVNDHVGSVISLLAHGGSEWNTVKIIQEVTVPTLIIHGTLDDIIPSKHSEEIYRESKAKKKLVLLENVGHQEMELLFALVQTLPDIHNQPISPRPISLIGLNRVVHVHGSPDETLFIDRNTTPMRAVYRYTLKEEAGGGGHSIGEKVIDGKPVLLC